MLDLNLFGKSARFHHVGVAVPAIEKSVEKGVNIIYDDIQKVSVAFIRINGVAIELIEPGGNHSPIVNSLKKGNKLVHLCYSVKILEEAINTAIQNGFFTISKPVQAIAFNNKRIVWLFSKVYGLVELVEE